MTNRSLADLYAAAADALRVLARTGDRARCTELAEAINLAIERADRARPLLAVIPKRPPPVLRTATRERPALLQSQRAPFDGAAREPTMVAPNVPADEEPSEAMAEAFFLPKKKPATPTAPPPDAGALVVLTLAGGDPELEEATNEEIVRQCMDTVAMLARHRCERPWRELVENEEQLLTQTDAIAVAGGECARVIDAWWRDEEDPWSAWAATFALANLEGQDTLGAIARALEGLAPEDMEHAACAAEALLVAPHPNVPELARQLAGSPNPATRAAGVDVLGRRGLLSPDEVRVHLADPNVPVLVAAIRAARVLPPPTAAPILEPLMHHPEEAVAWAAARQLALWGHAEPLYEVRAGRCRSLGQKALEIIVLLGGGDDLALLERVLTRAPVSEAQLSAVARFGSPRAWAFLVHHLTNDDFAESAARALLEIFGPCVAPEDLLTASAWQSAIAHAGVEANARYLRGVAWTPRTAVAEVRRGDAPREETQRRLDELAVRTSIALDIDLARWSPDVSAPLDLALGRFEKADYIGGTWKTRARI